MLVGFTRGDVMLGPGTAGSGERADRPGMKRGETFRRGNYLVQSVAILFSVVINISSITFAASLVSLVLLFLLGKSLGFGFTSSTVGLPGSS